MKKQKSDQLDNKAIDLWQQYPYSDENLPTQKSFWEAYESLVAKAKQQQQVAFKSASLAFDSPADWNHFLNKYLDAGRTKWMECTKGKTFAGCLFMIKVTILLFTFIGIAILFSDTEVFSGLGVTLAFIFLICMFWLLFGGRTYVVFYTLKFNDDYLEYTKEIEKNRGSNRIIHINIPYGSIYRVKPLPNGNTKIMSAKNQKWQSTQGKSYAGVIIPKQTQHYPEACHCLEAMAKHNNPQLINH